MAIFYKPILKAFKSDKEVLEHSYPWLVGSKHLPTMEERLGDAECPECIEQNIKKKQTRWVLLPEEDAAVIQGGKPYIRCLDCGYHTHL